MSGHYRLVESLSRTAISRRSRSFRRVRFWVIIGSLEATPFAIPCSTVREIQKEAARRFQLTLSAGIASRAIRALRLDERQIDADTALTYDLASATLPPWLKAEKCHRIYWASWITNLVNSDHYIVGTSSNPPPMTVPLPMSEEGYQFGVEEPLTNLDERLSLEALGGDPRSSGASVSAELVSAVFFW